MRSSLADSPVTRFIVVNSPRNSEENIGPGYKRGLMGIHTPFRLVGLSKSSTLDYVDGRKDATFEGPSKSLNKYGPTLSAAKM